MGETLLRAIAIVSPQLAERRVIEQLVRGDGLRVTDAGSAELVLLTVEAAVNAQDEVSAWRERMRGRPVVVIGPSCIDLAVASMSAGAADFLARPLDAERLRTTIARHGAARVTGRAVRKADMLLGESSRMREILAMLDRAASSALPALITGESGTGKELAARAIHYTGKNRSGPFIAINAGAITESLAEAELFGARRGAFTGADRDRPGVFVEANGGTLFLDEIATAPPALQIKLLRVLERGEVVPVGASKPVPVEVRVVAATNGDIKRAVSTGIFREDLFYRLAAIRIHMPPLRERTEDLAIIAAHHLSVLAAKMDRAAPRLTPGALARLAAHNWPGNVRELVNVLGNALLICRGAVVRTEDIDVGSEPPPQSVMPFREARKRFEEAYVRRALAIAGGSIAEAARLAGRERKDFYQLCKRAGVDVGAYRHAADQEDEPPDSLDASDDNR
jgi:DNA-binding NtrC family response regulator